MLCGFCSSENPDNSSFCRKCGKIIAKPISQSSQASGGVATAVAPAMVAASAPPMRQVMNSPMSSALSANQGMMPPQPMMAQPGFAAPGYAPAYAAPLSAELAALQGVGGWLMWFCIVLTFLQPLVFLVEAANNRTPMVVGLDLVLTGLSIATGVMVWRKDDSAFTLLKIYFGVMAVVAVLAIIGGVSSGATAEAKGEGFGAGFRILIFVGVWFSYFTKSKRVLATFGRNLSF